MSYPYTRPRRMRKHEFSRRLMRENHLTPADLICPLFVLEGNNRREAVASMPGVERLTLDHVLREVETLLKHGVPAVALFPVTPASCKTEDAREAYNPEGLVQRSVRALKREFPQLGVITDVALDPFTTHGQDGLIDASGYVLNDETVAVLIQQAVSHAAAGADMVAPSDMMDGRIGAIRRTLDAKGFTQTGILSYCAKYASKFYGPFREALDSSPRFGDKKTYQMDPSNRREALREARLDASEGADWLMVKPALAYLDVIRDLRENSDLPIAAYQVSGEYAMIKAAGLQNWIDADAVLLECLQSIRRAGADMILTYGALEAARALANKQLK